MLCYVVDIVLKCVCSFYNDMMLINLSIFMFLISFLYYICIVKVWYFVSLPYITLANQHGPQQCQHQLGWVPLMTVNKDVDLRHASQSVRTALTSSLLTATLSADFERGCLDPLGSPPLALTSLQRVRSHLAADTRKTAVSSINQPTAARASPAFIRRPLP
jgi:hypothetical protein